MVFRAIHALGPIARVDLARHTGLNAGTVSHIVDELIASGLASEKGYRTSARAGRRAVELEVNPSARLAVGVDLARAAVTGALVDLSGRVRERMVVPTPDLAAGELGFAPVHDVIDRLLKPLSESERASLVGIGIGVPSPVSVRTGRHLAPHGYESWHDLKLTGELAERHALPVFVDNNANTSALAELWFGAGQHVDDFLMLNLSVGVGAGLVLGGELYRGDHDLAGEVAHVTVDLDGLPCRCGNAGCLQAYVSVPAVLDAMRTELPAGSVSTTGPSIEEVTDAARAGDPRARRVFAGVARYLGAGIGNIVCTIDPRLILVGRELSRAGDALLEPLRAEVRRRVFPVLREAIRIEAAALADAPVIGAATLALLTFFQAPLAGGPAATKSPK